MNLEDIKNDYLRYLLIDKNYSKNTIDSYNIDLEKFTQYFKNNDIKKITSDNLKEYIKYLNN